MLKGQYQLQKKYVEEEVDSADELEPGTDESGFISQKLPHSNINVNPSRFSNRGSTHDLQASSKDRTNSPLKEKNFNHLNNINTMQSTTFKGQTNDQESETLKKLLYMSPKEAVQEYNKLQSGGVPQMQVKGSKSSEKSYSHSFNPLSSNKENARRDDENSYPQGPAEISAYTELAAKIYNEKFHNNNAQVRHMQPANPSRDNLLLSANEAQRIEDKRYLASREGQEDVVERLLKQGEAMSENKGALTNNYLSKELQECTFAPRILTGGPRRNFNQFLEDQKQFQEQKEMKKRKKQEQAMAAEKTKEDASRKPAICQGSVKLLEKKKNQQGKGPAHERLYSLGKNSQAKHMQGAAEKDDLFNRESADSSHFIGMIGSRAESMGSLSQGRGAKGKESAPKFTPNIHKKSKNLKREDRVDNLLYNDALRRQHRDAETSKMKSKSISMTTMSSASRRALAMRFIKEFDIAILEYLEVGKEPKLDYPMVHELLRKLSLMKEPEQLENPQFTPEKSLLYDMWYMLYGDKYHGIHRRNLLVFLLALLNLHFPITRIQRPNEEEQEEKNQEDEQEPNPLLDQFGNPLLPEGEERERKVIGLFDDDGNYELTEEEVRKLHKMYELWSRNRLSSADNLGQLISTRSQQEFSYKPEINEVSRNMAQNYREKMLEGTAELIQQNKIPAPKDGKITHADLLIVSKKVMEEKVNRYGELLKEEQTRDCTFKPQTKQYDSTSLNSSILRPGNESSGRNTQTRRQNIMTAESLGRDRVFELYSLAKPRILKKDKDALEADFEKNADECTFQPNIGHTRESKVYAAEPTELFAKGIEKTIDRMRTARMEKDYQNQQMQRGFTTGEEGHFVFSIDKGKFIKNESSGALEGMPSSQKGSRRDSRTSQYMQQHAQNLYGHGHMHGYGHEQYEEEEQEGEEQYEYEQQEGYEGQTYGIEQEEGLREVQEDENEAEEQQQYDDRYEQEEEAAQNEEEQPHFERDEDQQEDERVPLLFVDVNLGQGRTERIVVYEGDRSEDLAHKFSDEHNLDPSMKGKLKELLDSQIASLLSRIDEEMNSGLSETDRQHHSGHYMHDQIQEEEDEVEDGSYEEQ